MWDGVTFVDPTHDPIIYEGLGPSTVVVNNAGPGKVCLCAWRENQPSAATKPDVAMELRPGNTRALSGTHIRAAIGNETSSKVEHPKRRPGEFPRTLSEPQYAAIGWKVRP